MARRTPAERAVEAADTLTAWLNGFAATTPRPETMPASAVAGDTWAGGAEAAGAGEGASEEGHGARFVPACPNPEAAATDAGQGASTVPTATAPLRSADAGRRESGSATPLRLANTDWLYHHLAITGPADELARFRAAAAGAGVIPWQVDLDGAEEDLFHLLVAPPAPHPRVLSAMGARIVAAELRDAMERQRALALARVGWSRACPFDLHALLPVPDQVLALGPDHPDALAWLWAHWGTTRGLRRVEVIPAPRSRVRLPDEGAPAPGQGAFHLGFWSADWTPWRALARLAETWPALRFQVCPLYDRESG